MTNSQPENPLDDFGGLWRSAAPSQAQPGLEAVLQKRRRRNALRFWVTLVAELLVALVGVLYGIRLITDSSAVGGNSQVQGMALIVLLSVTTVLGLFSRRGQWRSVDGSPIQAAALELRRAHGRRLGCRIGWGVLAGVVAFVFWSLRSSGLELLSLRFTVLLAVSVGYVVALLILGRRANREVRQSQELLRQLSIVELDGSADP